MTGVLLFWGSLLALIYCYAGYPLLAIARARIAPRPVVRGPFTGTCTILMAARNEAANLPAKLASLRAQTRADAVIEILIGSDGSTDETVATVQADPDPRVRVHAFPGRRGKPSVLNDLMREARGDVVVLCDARQTLDPNALERLLAPLADPAVGVVSGELILVDEHGTPASRGMGVYWRYEKAIRRAESDLWAVPGATGALYAIRRELLHPIHPNTLCDDVAIPMQAVARGARCLFESGALVFDRPSTSAAQEATRKRRTIAGTIQLLRLYPRWLLPGGHPIGFAYFSHKVLRLFSPFLLMGLAVGTCMAPPGAWWAIAAGWGQALLYATALSGWWGGRAGVRVPGTGVALMFCALNLTTLLAWWDAAHGRFHAAWQQAYPAGERP
jgi:cellulose synthase/poly-beta-1,6-N-acetylglucosamine synthase-like glycosyltransferase